MGNSAPSTTQAVFGMTSDYKSFNIDLNNVTPEQKKICEDFFYVVGAHSSVNIINSSYNFEDFSYVVLSGVDNELVDLDYQTLSNEDKEKINTLYDFITEVSNR